MNNEIDSASSSAPHNNPNSKECDNVITKFVKNWESEEKKRYASLAEGARELFNKKFCEKPIGHHSISPVKCIIQARAKSLETIEESIKRRERDRKSQNVKEPDDKIDGLGAFTTVEDIRQAMPDLAGIRIILVFPDDEDKITQFIDDNTDEKLPPNYWGVDADGSLKVDQFKKKAKRKDRFVGYRALHYRVKLREDLSDDSNLANGSESLKSWWKGEWKKHLNDSWAEKVVEIQVTSMTMYAWQEVHHDLIYKTYEGKLTDEEVSTLDMVNGLVHANEIALNQFHQSLNKRLDSIRTKFRDADHLKHWVSTYLQEEFNPSFKNKSPKMKYAEQLLIVLQSYRLDTPEKLLNAIEEEAGEATRGADEEVVTGSIQHALDLIKEWRLELEQRLKDGSTRDDASTWVLFKICESKSPFKTITSDGKTEKDFIVMAALVMKKALSTGSKPSLKDFTHEDYAKFVLEKSSLGQILLWSGQKGKSDAFSSEDNSFHFGGGTLERLLDIIKESLGFWKISFDTIGQDWFRLISSLPVALGLALLKISAIPYNRYCPWPEQRNVFWPGTINIKALAAHLEDSEEPTRHGLIQGWESKITWYDLLVMVDDKWEHFSLRVSPGKEHSWAFIKTDIPGAMKNLDLTTLSENYPEQWLWDCSVYSVNNPFI